MSQCCHQEDKKWYQSWLVRINTLGMASIVVSTYFLPHLSHHFMALLFLMMGPIVLGLLLGGVIQRFIPESYMTTFLSAKRKRSVLYAVGLGFFMSVCSHGILAIAIQLYKKGASTSSVIAFLLASPWANLSITILMFGLFGLKATYIVVAALVIAVITGLLFQLLESANMIEEHPVRVSNEPFSLWADLKRRHQNYHLSPSQIKKDFSMIIKGAFSLSKMVVGWILLGIIAAAYLKALVPTSIIATYFSATPLGLFITLACATVIEICSEGTAPIAFELYQQTGALGNAFVFLMAGVATDYTEVSLIWTQIGKKTAFWFLGIVIPQVVLLGYIFNIFL